MLYGNPPELPEESKPQSNFSASHFLAGCCAYVICAAPLNLALLIPSIIYIKSCPGPSIWNVVVLATSLFTGCLLAPTRGFIGKPGYFCTLIALLVNAVVSCAFVIWGSIIMIGKPGQSCYLKAQIGVEGSMFVYVVGIILLCLQYLALCCFPLATIGTIIQMIKGSGSTSFEAFE